MGLFPWHFSKQEVVSYFRRRGVELLDEPTTDKEGFIKVSFNFFAEGWEHSQKSYEFYIKVDELANLRNIENVELLSLGRV